MIKNPFFLLLFSLSVLGILPQAKTVSLSSETKSPQKITIDLELLYQKWYVVDMTVNGESMEDGFEKGTYVQINRDKTIFTSENQPGEKEEVSSYIFTEPNLITVRDDSDELELSFKITTLSKTHMTWELEEDGQKVVIKYKSSL